MIQVCAEDGRAVESFVYLATPDAIEPALPSYDWYRNLVAAGARQNKLPAPYVEALEALHAVPDPMPRRKTRIEALDALAAAAHEETPRDATTNIIPCKSVTLPTTVLESRQPEQSKRHA